MSKTALQLFLAIPPIKTRAAEPACLDPSSAVPLRAAGLRQGSSPARGRGRDQQGLPQGL